MGGKLFWILLNRSVGTIRFMFCVRVVIIVFVILCMDEKLGLFVRRVKMIFLVVLLRVINSMGVLFILFMCIFFGFFVDS